MHALDQLCHALSKLNHGGPIGCVRDGLLSVAPRVEDQLRIAMVSEDPTEELPGNQVSHRPRFRFGERPWAYIGVIAGHLTRDVVVPCPPHVSVVAVRVHTDAAVGVLTAVLAPQSVPGA